MKDCKKFIKKKLEAGLKYKSFNVLRREKMTTHKQEYFSKKMQRKRSIFKNLIAWIIVIGLGVFFIWLGATKGG